MKFLDFRFDFLRLDDEGFPTENLVNGTTCYFVDTQQFYIYYNENWYLQGESEGGE